VKLLSLTADERGLLLVHPYDDERIIAGQGTIALEMVASNHQRALTTAPLESAEVEWRWDADVGDVDNIAAVAENAGVKAAALIDTRIAYTAAAFAEIVIWRVPKPLPGSTHAYKYRLAYVVEGKCVVRYDNETGKGGHRHFGRRETPYRFTTPERLIADFQHDIARWNDENRHT